MIHITAHAIERYQERVSNLPEAEVRACLSSCAIQTAAEIGAPFVRLGTGHRVVLDRHRVVTVLPVDHARGRMGTGRDEEHRRG